MPRTKAKSGRKSLGEGLTDKQQTFIAEYLIDRNSTRAARAAGYSDPNCSGPQLLDPDKYPLVAKAVNTQLAKVLDKAELKQEQILQELAYSAMRDPLDLCDENGIFVTDDLRKLPVRVRKCIESLEVRKRTLPDGTIVQEFSIRLTNKLAAIDMAMRHFGMYDPQVIEHKHQVTLDWNQLYQRPEASPILLESPTSSGEGDGTPRQG